MAKKKLTAKEKEAIARYLLKKRRRRSRGTPIYGVRGAFSHFE